MNQAKALQGKWFLPNNREETFTGTFHYSREEGCYLEIIGAFEDFISETRRKEIILGVVLDAGEVTLLDCSRIGSRWNLGDVTVSKYYVTFAFIGFHFSHRDEIQFDGLRASIADFDTWVGKYGINKLTIDTNEIGIDIGYQIPKDEVFALNDNLELGFQFECSFPVTKQIAKAEIVQKTYLGIGSKKILPFKELINHFYKLYKFLSLAYYDAPHIHSIHLTNSSIQYEKINKASSIGLLYSDNFFNKKYKIGKEHYDFLFTYEQISTSFPCVIKEWFAISDKISPAINILNALLLKREYSLELMFLSAIQAIETFHRNIYGGSEVSKEDHEKRLQSIFDNIPENAKKWLKEKLAFSNEPTLKQRINDLYDRIPEKVTDNLIKDREEFIRGVVKTRNYYTHYDSRLKDKIMPKYEVSKAIEKLKIFLVCLMLSELGLNKEQVIEIVQFAKVYPYAEV